MGARARGLAAGRPRAILRTLDAAKAGSRMVAPMRAAAARNVSGRNRSPTRVAGRNPSVWWASSRPRGWAAAIQPLPAAMRWSRAARSSWESKLAQARRPVRGHQSLLDSAGRRVAWTVAPLEARQTRAGAETMGRHHAATAALGTGTTSAPVASASILAVAMAMRRDVYPPGPTETAILARSEARAPARRKRRPIAGMR